jgi:hypothetical protein
MKDSIEKVVCVIRTATNDLAFEFHKGPLRCLQVARPVCLRQRNVRPLFETIAINLSINSRRHLQDPSPCRGNENWPAAKHEWPQIVVRKTGLATSW